MTDFCFKKLTGTFLPEPKGNDWRRIIRGMRGEKVDRIPYLEMEVTSVPLRYILGPEAPDFVSTLDMDPVWHVELGKRLGLDLIGFGFSHNPGRSKGGLKEWHGHDLTTWQGLSEAEKTSADYPKTLLIGGIDKNVLSESEENLRREVSKCMDIAQNGGYIPWVDHQVPLITLKQYKLYIKILKEYAETI